MRRRAGLGRERPGRVGISLVLAVLAAATFVSLAVTSVSTRSLIDGLGADPRRQLPLWVEHAGERLDLWFGQRRSDLAAFAGSAVLGLHAEHLGGPASNEALREMRVYLDALRVEYPAFESFIILDPVGDVVLLSGPGPIPARELRGLLASESSRRPGLRYREETRDHLVSAPLLRGGGGWSLHARIPAEAMATALKTIDLPLGGALHVLDARGREIASVGQGLAALPSLAGLHEQDEPAQVVPLEGGPLALAVVSAYGPFGWRLAASRVVEWDPSTGPPAEHRPLSTEAAAVFVSLLLVVLFASFVLRPVAAFEEATRVLTEADLGTMMAPSWDANRHELGMLTRTFVQVRGHLRRYQAELLRKREEIAAVNEHLQAQNEQLRQANRLLEERSVTDELTGLFNQRYFREHLPLETRRAARTGDHLALVLFDIDDFKKQNDAYGHAAGDSVLRQVAGVIRDQVRDMDLLARYGGEEFVLLASQTSLDGAVSLAEKIRLAVRGARIGPGDGEAPVRITVSAGVAIFRGDEDQLFEAADAALYRAKSFGKDRVVAGAVSGRPAIPSTPRLRPSPSRRGRRAS